MTVIPTTFAFHLYKNMRTILLVQHNIGKSFFLIMKLLPDHQKNNQHKKTVNKGHAKNAIVIVLNCHYNDQQ